MLLKFERIFSKNQSKHNHFFTLEVMLQWLKYTSQVMKCVFRREATSNKKSPIPIPTPKSQGGQFESGIDFYSQRPINTDAEYKVLSAIAHALEMNYDLRLTKSQLRQK